MAPRVPQVLMAPRVPPPRRDRLVRKGAAGLSAFELWQSQGNQNGTFEQYLASLAGAQGAQGLSAFQVWQSQSGNENGTVEQYLASLVGATGPAGRQGPPGTFATSFTTVTVTFAYPNKTATATCPAGTVAISGSFTRTDHERLIQFGLVGTSSWMVELYDKIENSKTGTLTAFCVNQ
jgi:hypothetical protein